MVLIRRHRQHCVINGKSDGWLTDARFLKTKGNSLKFTLNIETFQDFNDTNAIIDSCYQSDSLSFPNKCLASVCLLQNKLQKTETVPTVA